MSEKKVSDFLLFMKYERHYSIIFVLLIVITYIIGIYFSGMEILTLVQIITVPLTFIVAYFIFSLQSYYNYKDSRLKKNSLILSMLTELDHNVQLILSIRSNFVTEGGPKFIERIDNDKKIPTDEKIEIKNILRRLKQEKIDDPCDSVGCTINTLEKIYLDEKDDDERKRKVNYFLEYLPVYRVTFDFEDRLTYCLLNEINVKTEFDNRLIQSLSRYTWYANIMKYNFNLVTNWHDYKNHCDKGWYLNAIIARAQYSKDTLKIIKEILKLLIEDEEVVIELRKNKLYNLGM